MKEDNSTMDSGQLSDLLRFFYIKTLSFIVAVSGVGGLGGLGFWDRGLRKIGFWLYFDQSKHPTNQNAHNMVFR